MTRFVVVLAPGLCPAPLLADTPPQVLERCAELAKTTQDKGDIIAWPI